MILTRAGIGNFTGIKWSSNRQGTYDPYLLWAEATGFAGFGGNPADGWLPLVLQVRSDEAMHTLQKGVQLRGWDKWLRIPSAYFNQVGAVARRRPKFVTALVKERFFTELANSRTLKRRIVRIELGLASKGGTARDTQSTPIADMLSAKPVIAVIDDGCPLFHKDFWYQAGGVWKCRIARFWDQEAPLNVPAPGGPVQFGYGSEVTATRLESIVKAHGFADEERLYRVLGYAKPKYTVTHGSAVLGLAAGKADIGARIGDLPGGSPAWQKHTDASAEAEIIFVQLPRRTVQDGSAGSLAFYVLDALRYIESRVARTTPVTVNVSFGSFAGPHDGTAYLERSIDDLVARRGNMNVVVPVGNAFQSSTHALINLKRGESAELNWRVMPDDYTESYLEAWIELAAASKQQVVISVRPPSSKRWLSAVRVGQHKLWRDALGLTPSLGVVYARRAAQTPASGASSMALIALAPTASRDGSRPTAKHGIWQVRFENKGTTDTVIDAYIERDDERYGVNPLGRQSYFVDNNYDRENEGDDPPSPMSLIRRRGTTNSLATGDNAFRVGGYRLSDLKIAEYSPAGATGTVLRPSTTRHPHVVAVTEERKTTWGLPVHGTRTGSLGRIQGTSAASPQVARWINNHVSAPNPPDWANVFADLTIYASASATQTLTPATSRNPDREGQGRIDP
jgi:hypothetical protein